MITCDKFLNCAKRILTPNSIPEEDSRTAISRAYYSLFHQTLETTKNRYSLDLINTIIRYGNRRFVRQHRNQINSLDPNIFRQLNLHELLTKTLFRMGKNTLAMSFKQYRLNRNEADYDLHLTITRSDALTIVTNIEKAYNQIKSL